MAIPRGANQFCWLICVDLYRVRLIQEGGVQLLQFQDGFGVQVGEIAKFGEKLLRPEAVGLGHFEEGGKMRIGVEQNVVLHEGVPAFVRGAQGEVAEVGLLP
jgi:hypothetical protein